MHISYHFVIVIKKVITWHHHHLRHVVWRHVRRVFQSGLSRMWYSASFFNFQYPLVSIRSSSSCLHLLTFVPAPSNFYSRKCCRRQCRRNMWPNQSAFFHFIVCRMFLFSLTLCHTSSFSTRSIQLIYSILLQHNISKLHYITKHIKLSFMSDPRTVLFSLNKCESF